MKMSTKKSEGQCEGKQRNIWFVHFSRLKGKATLQCLQDLSLTTGGIQALQDVKFIDISTEEGRMWARRITELATARKRVIEAGDKEL